MDQLTSWIAFTTFLVWVYVVYIPITIYYTKKFVDYSWSLQMTKRNPKIVLIFIVSACIFIAIDRPLHLLYFTCLNLNYQHCSRYSNISLKITYPFSTLGIFLSVSTRIWLIFYRIRFNQSISNSQWKVLINPTKSDLYKNDFFIKHKKDLGNKRYVIKHIIFPIAIILYIGMVFEWSYVGFVDNKYRPYAVVTDTMIFILIMLFSVIILYKTPKSHDVFNIRGEAQQLVPCALIQFAGGLLLYFIGSMFMNWYIIAVIQAHYFAITTFIAILIQTCFVFKTLGIDTNIGVAIRSESLSPSIIPQSKPSTPITPITPSGSSPTTDMELELQFYVNNISNLPNFSRTSRANSTPRAQRNSVIIPNNKNAPKLRTLSLKYILQNDDYFDLFVQHLMKEYSSEIIISLIEFQMFQQYILDRDEFKHSLRMIDTETIRSLNMYKFTKSVPESFIVYGQNEENIKIEYALMNINEERANDEFNKKLFEVKTIAFKLYKKYIESGSEFELNISGALKLEFENLMRNYYVWIIDEQSVIDLLMLFQEIKSEMIILLNYSFNRFRSSDQFTVITKEIN